MEHTKLTNVSNHTGINSLIRVNGKVTLVTQRPHRVKTGDIVTVDNVLVPGFNGTFEVQVFDRNTVAYTSQVPDFCYYNQVREVHVEFYEKTVEEVPDVLSRRDIDHLALYAAIVARGQFVMPEMMELRMSVWKTPLTKEISRLIDVLGAGESIPENTPHMDDALFFWRHAVPTS